VVPDASGFSPDSHQHHFTAVSLTELTLAQDRVSDHVLHAPCAVISNKWLFLKRNMLRA